MLFPRPPNLPPRRRAVAEMTVRVAAPTPIAVGHLLPALRATDVITGDAVREAADAQLPICFSVSYRLFEYLALLHEHFPSATRQWEIAHGRPARDRLSWGTRFASRLVLPLMCVPIFLLKKRRMPVCRFAIDADGIERRTRGGTLRVAWKDVASVHRYRQAYLVDKGAGALPIPYRCLDETQRAAFERLLSAHGWAGATA